MKSQQKVVIVFLLICIIDPVVWGSFLDTVDPKVWQPSLDTAAEVSEQSLDTVWKPSLDTNFIEFKKKLDSLEFEPICSDCEPNVDLEKIFQSKNEDIDFNGFQILTKYCEKHEVYTVTTCDGYMLTFVRIPGNGPVVLLNHGLLSSFVDFFTSGTTSGLGYLLHKAGYDIWLTNCRGNTFSRNHTTLSPEDKEFWDFSWHEIGTRDLPAFIDFALSKTGKTQLIYIGHSQGTTSCMVLLSTKPEYNKKIKLAIFLSPVAFMSNAKSPLLRGLAPFSDKVEFIFSLLGKYDVMARDGFVAAVREVICYPVTIICSNILFLLCGFDFAQLNATALPVQYSHVPSGAAVKQAIHYLQEVKSKKFRHYDYGKQKNLIVYGSEEPPNYNLTNIYARIALFQAKNDWLADPIDVKKLVKILPNVVENYLVPFDKFNHLDFIWAKDAKNLLFNRVIELIEEYGDC